MSRMTKRYLVTAVALVGVAAAVILAAYRFASELNLARIEATRTVNSPQSFNPIPISRAELSNFHADLWDLTRDIISEEQRVLVVLRWVMNQVSRSDVQETRSPWRMVLDGRAGKGLACGGMADIFREALLSLEIPARRVIMLERNLSMENSHVTVEAWVNGKWRMYDPTFHIAVRAGNERIGAFEARDRLLASLPIELEFLGDVRYPTRVETYYIPYRSLLANLFVEIDRGRRWGRAIPVIGASYAPKWRYSATESTPAHDSYRIRYLALVLALPSIILVTVTLGVPYILRKRAMDAPTG